MDLSSPVSSVPGIGEVTAKKLGKLGIYSIFDLLFHLPFRYEDRSLISTLALCQPGEVVTVIVSLDSIKNEYTKSGKIIQKATISDPTGFSQIVWFNQPFLVRTLKTGSKLAISGKVDSFRGTISFISPEYEVLSTDSSAPQLHTGRLIPIYPETAGVTSKWLRSKINFVLTHLNVPNFIPDQFLLPTINHTSTQQALQNIHFPTQLSEVELARHRLAFDELTLLQLTSYLRKAKWVQSQLTNSIKIDARLVHDFIQRLPFTLTPSQQTSITDILQDLAQTHPMNRLLQGDVGSGKTVVAAIAAYATHLNGLNTLFFAPTTILAQQHFSTLTSLLNPFGISVELVTGHHKPKNLDRHHVIVGTHALLSPSLNITSVGLVVIDEQHRFGVIQRSLATNSNRGVPHVLTMTATPIPRTIALTLHADLDLSVLSEVPSGRQPVKTWVVNTSKRDSSYSWITNHLQSTHTQAFWVCPFIDPSETSQSVRSATLEFESLKLSFPTLRLGLLHGKLKPHEKDSILSRFRNHEFDILVTTPVVEVGIDIPNASLMVIEDANRFGLSQLHQLRGRVGRGPQKSYCLLFSPTITPRLKAMETHNLGSELAEIDFSLRGPGDIFGTAQHGPAQFRAVTYQDTVLFEPAKQAALFLQSHLDKYPLLRSLVKNDKISSLQPN
jgi:ATP-dependent DNA helicase RecG